MKQVLIFKTDVRQQREAGLILQLLQLLYPRYSSSFDLEDADNILRMEAQDISIDEKEVIRLLTQMEIRCTLLT